MPTNCSYCEVLSTWATVGEVALLVIGGGIAFWQLMEISNSRHLESTLAILRYLDNENFGRIRWFLYEHKHELQPFLHPQRPFCWEVKQEWDEVFKKVNKDRESKIDFYSIRSLIHALDNIAFLIEREYISYGKIMPNMMENHFRIANSLLGDYVRYSLQMEVAGVLFDVPLGYTASFGKNFLRLMDTIRAGHRPQSIGLLAKVGRSLKLRSEALEEKLDRMNRQRSLQERIETLEQAFEDSKHPPL